MHITNALTIFGPSIAGVRRKTVCCKSEQVEAELGRIPDGFHRLHRFVVMTADVLFVNGITFLTTLFWKLRLATIERCSSRTATQLSNSLMKIVRLYASTGFIVSIIMMDQEFDKVKDTCKMVKLNTNVAHEQVGEIKHYIRTIKEPSWVLVLDLPYTKLPRQVVIHLVYFAVLWLNSLPAAAGVSDKYSPHKIVLGCKLDFTRPPLDPTSKPMMIQPLPTLCSLAHSLGYSSAPLAITRAHTRSSTSTQVLSKNLVRSPPSPCRTGSSKSSKIGEDATKRKTR
jgi:hypothetical protein